MRSPRSWTSARRDLRMQVWGPGRGTGALAGAGVGAGRGTGPQGVLQGLEFNHVVIPPYPPPSPPHPAVTGYLQLGGHVQDICAEELPGVLWVVAEKGEVEPTLAKVRQCLGR